MPKIIVKITNLEKVKKQIKKKVSSDVFPKILKSAENNAIPRLIEEFNDALERTEAFQGLLGVFAGDESRDAQAHLGLTSSFAEDAVEQIKDVIRDKVFRAEALGKTKDGVIGFKFGIRKLADDISNIPSATYNSGDIELPWLKWLLKGGSVDAEITFKISARESSIRSSRSERALMIPTGDWNIDDYNRFSRNGNFVADALADEIWIANSEKIIIDEVKKALKNVNV